MGNKNRVQKKSSVIVSVTNDLNIDQRVQKVCNTLHNNGFEVLLIGRLLPDSVPLELPYKTYRLKLPFVKGFLFYASYNICLFFKLLFSRKDLLLSNDLDTLLPNYLISTIFKKKLVYDSHELFTEVPELIGRKFVKNCWLSLEKLMLPKLKNCYTVCKPIADHYNTLYGTTFGVIKNFPRRIGGNSIEKDFDSPSDTSEKKIIIYQGTLNVFRGIELIIDAMPFLNNVIFQIVGSGLIREQLRKQVKQLNLEEKVHFIPRVQPHQLRSITSKAHLGISLEEDKGLNYRYALPNKLFDYVHAGVPVLVSDLPEMKKIVEQYHIGEVVTDRNPKALARQIETLLYKKDSYQQTLEYAKKELVWENQEENLLSYFR